MARKRIQKELAEFSTNSDLAKYSPNIVNENYFEIQFVIPGPEETPYEGGLFYLKFNMPKDYPFKPPRVNFETKIYHPNFNCSPGKLGIVCCCTIDVLHHYNWSPSISFKILLKNIEDLMKTPANSPGCGNYDTYNLYLNNKEEFNKIAKEWTQKNAMDNNSQ